MPLEEKLKEYHEWATKINERNNDGFLNRMLPELLLLLQDLIDLADEKDVEDLIRNLGEPFSATLMRIIDEKGMKDSDVYKRANIDRRTFSKIRNPDYHPSKRTTLALAVGLELDLDETNEFLKCAGFALSQNRKFDVIVQFFIVNKRYNILEINSVLYDHDQQLLGR